jgi:hypothetical protein
MVGCSLLFFCLPFLSLARPGLLLILQGRRRRWWILPREGPYTQEMDEQLLVAV